MKNRKAWVLIGVLTAAVVLLFGVVLVANLPHPMPGQRRHLLFLPPGAWRFAREGSVVAMGPIHLYLDCRYCGPFVIWTEQTVGGNGSIYLPGRLGNRRTPQ